MNLVITAGSLRGRRFTVTNISDDGCTGTLRRIYWWTDLGTGMWHGLRDGFRLGRRWIHYGWLLHVAVCVSVAAVEGICGL